MTLKSAIRLYDGFHKFEPKRVGKFPGKNGLVIPEAAMYVGDGKQILYSSDKFHPITEEDEGVIEYFHDHKPGVKYLRCDTVEGRPRKIPKWIHEAEVLTYLGKCLGFTYTDFQRDDIEAKCSGRLPELYAVPPKGKALLVVQDKRQVVCVCWGGKLQVEPRGIVG